MSDKKMKNVIDKKAVKTAPERIFGEDDVALQPFDASDAFLADSEEWDFGNGEALVQDGLDSGALAELMKQGFESEQYVKLPDGGRISGYFLGKGAPVMMYNPQNRSEMRPVDTWRIKHSKWNIVMVISSSSQLDGKLGPITKGEMVIVQKMGQTDGNGGRRVNNFAVFHNPSDRIDVSKYDERRGTETMKLSEEPKGSVSTPATA